MNKEEKIDLLQQAIQKTQEVYEILTLLETNGLVLMGNAYTGSTDYISDTLRILHNKVKQIEEAERKSKAEEIWKKRLCEKLGITPFWEDTQ